MSTLLADPPGRQGPGPMQGALVEALDLVLATRASGALPGERRAAGRGTGTELSQIRPYQFGDERRTGRFQHAVPKDVLARIRRSWFGTFPRLCREKGAIQLGHFRVRLARVR